MPIDLEYLRYCHFGEDFYVPSSASASSRRLDDDLEIPADWQVRRTVPWTMCASASSSVPRQGWKLHVSSTRGRSRAVLGKVAEYCTANDLAFKYLSTEADFDAQNSKYAERGSAGKFITIYPPTADQFQESLIALGHLLRDEDGPYILSDRRWKNSPVFYRYGAFWPAQPGSKFVTSLIDPDGREVEDVRRPAFVVPEWVEVPEFLKLGNEASELTDFPFKVIEALHFSNGGGVYVAQSLTDDFVPAGAVVVLKEARPHTAIDGEGADAVARLRHEVAVLGDLQGTGYVPKYFGTFRAWEHHYAVMERVDGHDLKRTWMLRTPVLKPEPWKLHDPDYLDWLNSTVAQLDHAVEAFHDRGWLLGDIHPKNVIMQGGVRPVFIDFEFAHPVDDQWRSSQGAPGYEPAVGLAGAAADLWSLGIMELDLLLPQATIADQGNYDKIEEILRHGEWVLAADSTVAEAIRAKTVRQLENRASPEPDPEALPQHALMRAFADGIVAAMDLHADGPVVPADIVVYKEDGDEAQIGFPHGLSGVLAMLRVSGQPLPEDMAERSRAWLGDRLDSVRSRGLAGKEGLELGLRLAGLTDVEATVRRLDVGAPDGHSYWSGWSGVGLHALMEEAPVADTVEETSESLRRLMEMPDSPSDTVGLLHGWSGPALFWARALTYDARPEFADLAREAIARDLARCGETTNGTIEFDETWRTLPYLGTGSVAVALAIRELATVTGRAEFSHELALIHRAATYNQYGHAGFAHGVAGFLPYLNRYDDRFPRDVDVLESHLDALRLHAIRRDGSLLIRGNQGLRLSCDFLTGAAGVVGALASLEGRWSGIPFLPGTGTTYSEGR